MDGQELYNLHEAYLEVYDEGYKPPRGKMARRVAHKMFKGVNTLKKAHDAGEDLDPKGGTVGGQIAGQKSEKLGRQAQKIYQTAQRHNPEVSKEKERQNRAVGEWKRKFGPRAAAALRDRFNRTGPRPKKNLTYGQAIRDGIRDGINDAIGEQYDIYDIILSHLLDEGYAETPEAAEAMMVNMSEEWRYSIIEAKKEFPHKKVDKQIYDAMDSGETAGDEGDSDKMKRDYSRADKMRSVAAKHGGKRRS